MNPRSISFKLSAWYTGLLTSGFLLFGVILWFGIKHHLEANVRELQYKRATVIAETLVARIDRLGEADVIHGIRDIYAPELNSRFVRVTRPDGSTLFVSGVPSELTFNPKSVPRLSGPVKSRSARIEQFDDGNELLIAVVPVPGLSGNPWHVEVGAPLAPVRAVQRDCLLTMVLAFPLMLLVAVGGGLFLARRALQPVEKIIRSARQLSSENLSGRLPVPQTGDELERLSVALNDMIGRLDDAFQHNRRFLGDASHELRTPLTIMRGELEVMLEQADGAPELQARIASTLEEVERLATIVESLFALSRLEAGEGKAEWVPVDLGKLAASTADQMKLLAEDRGVTLQCEHDSEVMVRGDRGRLKQIIVNLLDNAIKHTSAGGSVVIRARTRDGRALLDVSDTGEGIPPAAIPQVFERFFRVDEERSRSKGGAGIGLSIVKSITAAHGGSVSVESEANRGTCFHVELPQHASSGESSPKTP